MENFSEELDKIQDNISTELDYLFAEAQKRSRENDEFKYILLLLGCNSSKGVNSVYGYPENETFYMYEKMKTLSLEQEYKDMRIRLALLLYCHLYEANFIPRILYNLLTIIETGEYNEWPFPYNAQKNWEASSDTKIKMIKEKAISMKLDSFAGLLDTIYDKKLRNSFFHSDYTFGPDGLLLSVERNMLLEHRPYDDLNKVLNSMCFFFELFMETWTKYKSSYPDGYQIKMKNSYLICTLSVDPQTNQIIGLSM